MVNTLVNLVLPSFPDVWSQHAVVHYVVCYVVKWELLVVLTSLHYIRLLLVSPDLSLLQVSPCGVGVACSFRGFVLFPSASLQIFADVYDP